MGVDSQSRQSAAMTIELTTLPEPHEAPEYYFKYIRLVPQGPDIRKVLSSQTLEVAVFLERISEEQSKARYAPGKWSVGRCWPT